jgi:hypothetical protein
VAKASEVDPELEAAREKEMFDQMALLANQSQVQADAGDAEPGASIAAAAPESPCMIVRASPNTEVEDEHNGTSNDVAIAVADESWHFAPRLLGWRTGSDVDDFVGDRGVAGGTVMPPAGGTVTPPYDNDNGKLRDGGLVLPELPSGSADGDTQRVANSTPTHASSSFDDAVASLLRDLKGVDCVDAHSGSANIVDTLGLTIISDSDADTLIMGLSDGRAADEKAAPIASSQRRSLT